MFTVRMYLNNQIAQVNIYYIRVITSKIGQSDPFFRGTTNI